MQQWWSALRTRYGLRNPFASLPGRLSFFVFAATLLTSLVVTWISVNSIETFLREKIDQKFPAILSQSAEKLELWYGQRELDVGVFSSSSIVMQNLGRIDDQRARAEIEQYLRYVLDRFPQYGALFVLDRRGQKVLWVGEELPLSDELRRFAAEADKPAVSDVTHVDSRRVQLAAASIRDPRDRRIGSLGALLRLESLDAILTSEELGPLGKVFAVRTDGSLATGEAEPRVALSVLRPGPDSVPVVRDYTSSSGERVVGCALSFPRFGWTLVVEEPYDQAFEPVVAVIGRILGINLAIVLLFGIGALQVANSIVRPIEALSEGARRVSAGERDVEIPETGGNDEVGLLTRAFNQMIARLHSSTVELEESRREVEGANDQLRRQNDELQRMNEVLEQLSITDGLTRLHNHRHFQDCLTREAKRSDRSKKPLALILVDLDHFKAWNDRLGHAGGDEILRRIADVMNDVIRETDLLSRYGGEEFALLAAETDLEGARQLAEKIRQAVRETDFGLVPPGEDRRVTVSVGVAAYRGSRQKLFEDADRALYRAKDAGRDCVAVADADSSSE